MDDLLTVKVGALIIVFLLAISPGLLPLKLRAYLLENAKLTKETTSILLSSSLCCGAGVLMATVFLHILGEAREGFSSIEEEYPIGEFVMCLGFFLVYLVEESTHWWVSSQLSKGSNDEDIAELNNFRRTYSNHRLSFNRMKNGSIASNSNASILEEIKSSSPVANNNTSEIKHPECDSYLRTDDIPPLPHQRSFKNKNIPVDITETTAHPNSTHVTLLRSMIVIAALSLHGALEGLALGLENERHNVWLLCLALSAHKIFIAFSIGMELLEQGTTLAIYLFHMAIFSLASPLGGIVGIVLTSSIETDSEAGLLTIASLQGISAGAILYVVFCEVLERERCKDKGKMLQLLSVFVGFAIMASIGYLSRHHHNHSIGHQHELAPEVEIGIDEHEGHSH